MLLLVPVHRNQWSGTLHVDCTVVYKPSSSEQTVVLQTLPNLIVCKSSATHDYKFLFNVRKTLHTISAHVLLLMRTKHNTADQSLA